MPRLSTSRLLVPALLTAALLVGCSAGTETVAGDDDPVIQVPSSAPTPSSSAASSAPIPAVRVVSASYEGGEVVADSSRVETSLGERIVLRLSSDVSEEIHVHGYDVYADVPAGGSIDIPLELTLPGSYEVELHEAGRPLLQLRTS